ncbi:MAG: hypothetical protein DMG51_20800 [Acidobacteria bacterium]|nr:MAG: hypothetical protein DMG51_20800 [Acidobacteriota bacterium]
MSLALTSAANSFNSIFPPPGLSSRPAMKSRNGYEATAIRSRGGAGKRMLGPASTASAVRTPANRPGHSPAKTTAAEPAASARNRLRVVGVKTAPV